MSSRSNRIIALVFLAAVCACYAGAQGTSDYDTQLLQGAAQLQAGDANQALSSADAAIRMAPDRWDGFALAGRALSKAIELAPPAQQSALRALRRSSLVQESGAGAAPAVQTPAAPAAPVAPATVEAAPEKVMLLRLGLTLWTVKPWDSSHAWVFAMSASATPKRTPNSARWRATE